MDKLFVVLGIIAIIAGGIFVINQHNLVDLSFMFDYLSEGTYNFLMSGLFWGVVIAAIGFIRFNKFLGIALFVIGGLSLLSHFEVLPVIIPVFILPYVLVALGVRFLLIGILSGEHKE